MEKIYKAGDVAKTLECGESTLRKWMAALQKANYPWTLDEHGWKMITERDLITLRKMQETIASGLSLEKASSEIVIEYGKSTREGNYLARIENEQVTELTEIVKSLTLEVQELRREIRERDNERDHKLLETMKIMLEARREIATESETKKSKWKFWTRK